MRKLTFILAIIFLTLSGSGCKAPFLTTTDTVTFFLPDPPRSAPLLYWEIQIRSPSPAVSQSLKTTSNQITILVQKNQPVCIMAQPVTILENGNTAFFFKPAGTIYPYDYALENCSQTLTWEGGYAAFLFNQLLNNGENTGFSESQLNSFISSFNWQKLLQTIITKSKTNIEAIEKNPETKFYNPWHIDSTRLLDNLSSHSFSANYLNTTYLFNYSLEKLMGLEEGDNSVTDQIISSYEPQNKAAQITHTLTLKKNTPELLLYMNQYGLYAEPQSAKNISLQMIYMPIIKEAL